MAFAHVNIADVSRFKESISDAKEVFFHTQDQFYNTLDIATEKVNEGIREAKELIERCQKSIQALEREIERLQEVLAGLQASLAVTPPTITETTQDEEGNVKTEEYPNPRYLELQSEISSCEAEISAIKSQQEQFKSLQQRINSDKERLDHAIQSFQTSLDTVSDQYERLNSVSEEAVNKLTKIEEVLHKYLEEKLRAPKRDILIYRDSTITQGRPDNTGDNTPPRRPDDGGDMTSSGRPDKYGDTDPPDESDKSTIPYADLPERLPNHDEDIAYPQKWQKWKKIEGEHDWYSDLCKTNPNFPLGKGWQVNCQRCVPAYEMRRRGYSVIAKLRGLDGDGDYLSTYPFAVWENPDVIRCRGNGRNDIETMMKRWGVGARAEVCVTWNNTPKGHTFVAENREDGVIFYDPLDARRDASPYFDVLKSGETKFCRIDTLEPSKWILECCEEVE